MVNNLLRKTPGGTMAILGVMALLAPVVMFMPSELRWIWMIVYIILGVVAALVTALHLRKEKKRSQQFDEDVKAEAGKAPSLKDPDKLAELDHLRREFQRGIDVYKAYGKDLYSLPWYVIVGESGAGKTEAVRNSEVGFPDKLQDRQQGTGGTYSMHWWFTNYAVILDTAGRLFFESADEGGKGGWASFLKMLKKNRPDCPINGLILVLPATSLKTEYSEEAEIQANQELQRRAGQIAHQLEVIHTHLAVRFPVYVVITKTDKIPGFREYFDGFKDAKSRYQMFGWSNPDPLDAPFNPALIDQHIIQIAERLRKRRMLMLKDPTPRDPDLDRIDEVDALYALPDSFEMLAPKLRRYLEHVFLTDEWAAKPPYLRGIYFTSAMQEGAVLDRCIAEALGVRLDALEDRVKETSAWKRNRAFFLRDLFTEKMFHEQGLVTRTGASGKKVSRTKRIVLTALTVLVAGVLGLGFARSLQPEEEVDLWKKAEFSSGTGYLPTSENHILGMLGRTRQDGDLQYLGDYDVEAAGPARRKSESRLEIMERLDAITAGMTRLGWIYFPAQLSDPGKLNTSRREARRIALNHSILRPLLDVSMDHLEGPVAAETPEEVRDAALLALTRFRIGGDVPWQLEEKDGQNPRAEDEIHQLLLKPLFEFATKDRVPEEDLQRMAKLLAGNYSDKKNWWTPRLRLIHRDSALGDGDDELLSALEKNLGRTVITKETLKEIEDALGSYDEALRKIACDGDSLSKLADAGSRLDALPLDRLLSVIDAGDKPVSGEEDKTKDEDAELLSFKDQLEWLVDGKDSESPFAERVHGLLARVERDGGNTQRLSPKIVKLANDYLAREGGEFAYNRFLPLLKKCADPAVIPEGLMDKDQVQQLGAEVAKIEELRSKETTEGVKTAGKILLDCWKRRLASEFVERYLFFPLVFDKTRPAYGEPATPAMEIAIEFLKVLQSEKALKDVVDIRDMLFDEKGQPVEWTMHLGADTEFAMFVRTLHLRSFQKPNLVKATVFRADKLWSQPFLISDDLEVALKEGDQEIAGFSYFQQRYGVLKLLRDVSDRELANDRQISLVLAENAASGAQGRYFRILLSGPKMPDPNKWPTLDEIRRLLGETPNP